MAKVIGFLFVVMALYYIKLMYCNMMGSLAFPMCRVMGNVQGLIPCFTTSFCAFLELSC